MLRAVVLAFWLCGGLGVTAQWQQISDFPGTARDDAAAFSYYCKVYVGTGMEVGWSLTNDWWRYDVIQQSWQQVASLPATPRQYATAHSIEGIGYLFGGLDATGPLNELWTYDTALDQWNARSPLPADGRYASSSFVANSKLYVVGGLIAGGTALSELWEYDPGTDGWTQRANLPGVPRHRATATSIWHGSEENGLVIGGADDAYLALDEVWRYEPSTDSWFAASPLPEARFGASSTTFIDQPLVVAGTTDNITFLSSGFLYNSFTDAWDPFGDLPNGRRGGVMGFSHQCSGYYFAFYGAGLDQDLVRRNDWFSTGFVFGMEEGGATPPVIFPNPVGDHLTINLPVSTASTYEIRDALGRTVDRGTSAQAIAVTDLAAGKYELVVSQSSSTFRAPFIKLP